MNKDFVIVKEGQLILFKVECSTIAQIVSERNFKLYNGGLVIEDGTPYHILFIAQNDDGSLEVTLIYHDHYQIGYHEGATKLYMSDDNHIEDNGCDEECSSCEHGYWDNDDGWQCRLDNQ